LNWSASLPQPSKCCLFHKDFAVPVEHGYTMRACNSQQQQSDTILAVLDIVAGRITSVYTLSQLSVVNKRCRTICAEHASHQLQALLLPVLRQAAGQPKGPMQQQHMSSIKWLCSTARKEAFAAASYAVTAVPRVPAAAVRMLLAAGVRVYDTHIIDAALKQQPGVELWGQARVALHGPAAVVGSSDAALCAAFALAELEEWKGLAAAATASYSSGGTASGAAARAAAEISWLEFVACYATQPQVGVATLCAPGWHQAERTPLLALLHTSQRAQRPTAISVRRNNV
jgi:hypothetical protein